MLSYWQDSANAVAVGHPFSNDVQCEVAIVGGGYTGLAAAKALTKRGVDFIILEANDIGWGASGRNGGSVTPRYKMGFGTLAKTYGHEIAQRLHTLLHQGVRTIKENVQESAIECDYAECGQVTAAHSAATLKDLRDDIEWLRGIGDTVPRVMEREETRERLGLDIYQGAYLDMRGARVHPFNYARGLAAALQKNNVRIFTRSAVEAIRQEQGTVSFDVAGGGRVTAKQVILATDAYLTPGLGLRRMQQLFLNVASALLATAPLPADVLRHILPGRHITADTFALLSYYHVIPGGRLLFGGRGKVTPREDSEKVFAILEKRMRRLFPAVGDVPVTHRWSGLVGLSKDSLPHATSLNPSLHAGFGYGGRGVVLSHIVGQAVAALALGEDIKGFGPLASTKPAPFYFHGLQRRLIGTAVKYFAVRDWMQKKRA